MKTVSAIIVSACLLFSANLSADQAAGQSSYAARGCIGCHGAGGISVVSTYPSLRGRSETYIRQNLTQFRSGKRKNAVMNAMTAGLSDTDIENIADYIGSLKQ